MVHFKNTTIQDKYQWKIFDFLFTTGNKRKLRKVCFRFLINKQLPRLSFCSEYRLEASNNGKEKLLFLSIGPFISTFRFSGDWIIKITFIQFTENWPSVRTSIKVEYFSPPKKARARCNCYLIFSLVRKTVSVSSFAEMLVTGTARHNLTLLLPWLPWPIVINNKNCNITYNQCSSYLPSEHEVLILNVLLQDLQKWALGSVV